MVSSKGAPLTYVIINLVDNFVIGRELGENVLEVDRIVHVRENHAVEVHRLLVAVDLKRVRLALPIASFRR